MLAASATMAPGLLLILAHGVPRAVPPFARTSPPRCCAQPPPTSPPTPPALSQPTMSAGDGLLAVRPSPEALREQVQRDLRRADRGEPVELMRAQAQAVSTGVGDIVELLQDVEASGASISALLTSGESCLPREVLDQKLALQLPLLMRPDFPQFMRRGLEKTRSPLQQLALLEMNRYVLGAYEEMADGVVDLHWQQLNKMRELCDAAADGGPQSVQAVAEVMRAELDTAFCNFLNEAIEQEEARLRALGLEPVPEPKPYFASLKDDGRAAGGEEDDESGQNGPGQWPGTSAALEAAAQAVALRKQQQPEGGGGGAVGGIEAQQWLLVLRTVKRGVYALLAKDRDDDIKQVRYICNLSSASARRELTLRVLDELTKRERQGFVATVRRIADNLSVPRNARDEELRDRVAEIRDVIDRTGGEA